ncbi:MAG TPA: hypothetical protein VES19_15470 [Candidatus Limnocylindrales bacterium]|nr:hypothetical protein [Candidatus Limnocylindrales bacterium]
MNDVWVCATCKSINRQRDDRCYKCTGRRHDAMAPEGSNARVAAAVANRAARGYSSTLPFALIASTLILAVAALGFVLVILQLQAIPAMRQVFVDAMTTGSSAPLDTLLADQARLAVPSLVRTILLLLAVLGFGLWLSRVVLNIPALGGGTPSWGPMRAFFFPLIPIVNIIKVPGMLQDALYRLDPTAGGFFMVLAAWIGFFGSWLVALVGQWIITGMAINAILAQGTMAGAVNVFGSMIDQVTVLTLITEAMIAVGAVLLVAIMVRIERRAAARDHEIRAAFLGLEGVR